MTVVVAIQMASGPNVNANLLEAERLIANAVTEGAELVVLPENFALMGHKETDKVEIMEAPGEGELQKFLSQQAKKHSVWIVGGSIPMQSADKNRIRAACLLFNDQGEQLARYDKIHLFDVSLPGSDEQYIESETIEPGNETIVIDTPFGKLGLAICYDLRFPEMFRELLDKGMEVLVIPSAFTEVTGRAHWEPLLRARAIENQCYVIAAAQGGYHANGRETHGNSMVIDPWGIILNRLSKASGVVKAEVDLERVKNIRQTFPAVEHRRLSCKVDS
ncbi:MAG: carbon-nitrogen hydrolase family protein [Gammaproteobacteria bacterium]|nr:carbon-nitrogen hydrolase family protein [Gammaproteobacteria bacterium]